MADEDIRQKNQKAAQRQAETREKERQEKMIEINKQFADLTKRNAEYMIKLNRALNAQGYDPEKKATALNEVYEELKVKQKQGYTAAKLYGPAAKKADDIINGPKRELENKPPKFWESALDNGLLMFVMFCAMYGILGLFSKRQTADAGWLTIVSTSVIAGLGLAEFYKVMNNRKAKHRILRAIGVFLGLLIVWFAAFALIAKIPPQVNPAFTPLADILFALIGFGVRYLLKKKLNIRSF